MDVLHLDCCFVCKQKPEVLKWKATVEDHVIDPTAIVVATRHWGGVDEKTKEGFNSIFVVSLHQIGARRAFHRTPAETGCGTRAPAFRQTSLQAQKQERGDLVGSLLGRGRVISQDPCSVSAPGYTVYSRGSSPSSPWRVSLPSERTSIKKRLKSNTEHFTSSTSPEKDSKDELRGRSCSKIWISSQVCTTWILPYLLIWDLHLYIHHLLEGTGWRLSNTKYRKHAWITFLIVFLSYNTNIVALYCAMHLF